MRLVRAWMMLVWLTFSRLLWSSGTWVVLLPLIGCGLVLWRQRYDQITDPVLALNRFSHDFVISVFAMFIVPVCSLAYATTSIGGDREDHTLLFVLIRPVPRWLVLLAKLTATIPLVTGLLISSFYLYCQQAGAVGEVALDLYLPAVFLMAIAYTCLFQLMAVVFRHSTIVALIYSLFMELVLGNLPGIIKRVAINYYGRSIMYRAGETQGLVPPRSDWFEPISYTDAQHALLFIAGGSLLVSLMIFQRREYRDLT